MTKFRISDKTAKKIIEKHGVTVVEICEAFMNRQGKSLEDSRLQHKTIPPTLWFIAPTNHNRKLKVVYIQDGGTVEIKTAFEPNEEEKRIYARYG